MHELFQNIFDDFTSLPAKVAAAQAMSRTGDNTMHTGINSGGGAETAPCVTPQREITNMQTNFIDVVFDGPPGPVTGRFVEVENAEGKSIRAGEWIDRGNGLWALRIGVTGDPKLIAAAPELMEALKTLWDASAGTSDDEIHARLKARLAIAKATES